MINKRHIYLLMIFILTLTMAGCFEFEERIYLNKDDSGTMEVEYWTLDDVNIQNDSFDFPQKEADIRKEVEEKYTSDRVKLKEFNVKYDDNSRLVRFKVAFDNVLDLNGVPQFHKNRIRYDHHDKSIP